MLTNSQIAGNLATSIIAADKATMTAVTASILAGFHYGAFAKQGSVGLAKGIVKGELEEAGVNPKSAWRHVDRGFAFAAHVIKKMPQSALVLAIQEAHEAGHIKVALKGVTSLLTYLNCENASNHVDLWSHSDGLPLTLAQKQAASGKSKAQAGEPVAPEQAEAHHRLVNL